MPLRALHQGRLPLLRRKPMSNLRRQLSVIEQQTYDQTYDREPVEHIYTIDGKRYRYVNGLLTLPPLPAATHSSEVVTAATRAPRPSALATVERLVVVGLVIVFTVLLIATLWFTVRGDI